MKKKLTNPLRRRVLREIKGEWHKYLVIFLLLVGSIGFVSGMYVANHSMLEAVANSVEENALEDGHFELKDEADEELLDDISSGELAFEDEDEDDEFEVAPVTLYENYYRDATEDNDNDGSNDGKVRLFKASNELNHASFIEGNAPQKSGEIAIDRMHAENNDLKIGDEITVAGESYEIVGLLAYVNYSTLHESNTDLMFDALSFDVAMITDEDWDDVDATIHYCYAWKYDDDYSNDSEQKKLSDNFMKALLTQTIMHGASLEDYVPRYANQAVNFAPDDMGKDKTMGGVLLYILVIIMGFVFAVTISGTITKESTVIGTLRASGYTKGELVRHYMAMPILVTIAGAIVGNVLGYTLFKKIVADMYYNSYSLPAFKTYVVYEAFFKTTVVPVILMILINLIVINYMLRLSPLRFIRRDLKTVKRKKAIRLPRFKFLNRFRLRILLQNIPSYVVLFLGIFFVVFLTTFAFGLPSTLKSYQEHITDDMFAKYQYILKSSTNEMGETIETDVAGAEKFSMTELKETGGVHPDEAVSVYGVEKDSKYIDIPDDISGNEVVVSSAYKDKFGLSDGDTVVLQEKYSDDVYEFVVAGEIEYMGGIAVFLSNEAFNEVFDYDEDSFSGYLSNKEITNIEGKYIAMTITEEDLTKVSRQLDHSMGSYMDYFKVVCLAFAAILIYLLTKTIIEKNENSISMVKILGYLNNEISSLYLTPTTIAVVIEAIISAYLSKYALTLVWTIILWQMDGWLPASVPTSTIIWIVLIVIVAYVFVMLLDYRRIRNIPMDQALKNVE
ncbi:MAG: ABC transporter permease [Lachnospiraceae bacterium]|nr:ABC transporter permease [Lachnospiraceae bacterium]